MISFIIPCYNEEKSIFSCISRIQEEIHRTQIPAEIIVVDNNCTDRTAEYAKKAGAIVVTEPRKGVVWARQKGYEIAKYDLIANIDADSFMPTGWITTAIENLKEDDVVAITGPLNYFDANLFIREATKIYYLGAYVSNKFIGATIQGGNCVIKKKYLDMCNGYDTSIPFYGEDTMTAMRIHRYGRVKLVLDLVMDSSSRRLQNQGVFNTTWIYIINYLSVVFFNRPYTTEYKDYR
jgi:glycosyltransferase involved in cell wall biosynthesis